jgi:hypothetical protein
MRAANVGSVMHGVPCMTYRAELHSIALSIPV